jgi:L-ascorbate metabolism protein UlaG (beta-lactamase superfamily)
MPSFELVWLGQAAFHVRTQAGKHLLIDPWLANPLFPNTWTRPAQLDAILVTHAHGDHVGDTINLAHRHQPEIVAPAELCHWLKKRGARETRPMNKGGTQSVAGVAVTMVGADHSSGFSEGDTLVYGGSPAGFVLTFEGGERVYHAGDTNVFGDMALIGELYPLDVALLPIGGHFTMGPAEAAKAVELLRPRFVVPMHYGTSPKLTGTPGQFEPLVAQRAPATRVLRLAPGEVLRLPE